MKNEKEMSMSEILSSIEQAKKNLDTTITIKLTKEQSKIHTDGSIYGIIKGLEGMVGFLQQTLIENGIKKEDCNTFIKELVAASLNNSDENAQFKTIETEE